MVVRTLEEVVDGDSINRFLVEDRKRLRKNLERGVKVKQDQGFEKNWNRTNKTTVDITENGKRRQKKKNIREEMNGIAKIKNSGRG